MEVKLPSYGLMLTDRSNNRVCSCNLFTVAVFFCLAFLIGSPFLVSDFKQRVSEWGKADSIQNTKVTEPSICKRESGLVRADSIQHTEPDVCKSKRQGRSRGTELLPKGIISKTSNLEMRPLWSSAHSKGRKADAKVSKSLLAIPVGIKQKKFVDQIVKKFSLDDFTVMLFHYDGIVDQWRDLKWSDSALHISAINQTKWWFAKRFLHPDIVEEYDYIFLWDEDLGVEHFHAGSYLSIVKREGLDISQPALDTAKSEVHHRITARWRRGDVHRRMYKFNGSGRCYENSTGPPCTGWVEMMAPVFSRAAWRCAWHMVQNDLIYAWGLDYKLGYCAQGDRSKKVGVVDSQYIVHKAIPTLGGSVIDKSIAAAPDNAAQSRTSKPGAKVRSGSAGPNDRLAIRYQSYTELETFKRRWAKAVNEDHCWTDPYPESTNTKKR